jgi:membrane-associated protease RseP (regulator of RpoE activity)
MRFLVAVPTIFAFSVILAGCATVSRFSGPVEGNEDGLIASSQGSHPHPQPVVETAEWADMATAPDANTRLGFMKIGKSYFTSLAAVPDSFAVAQGAKLGAVLVLIFGRQYSGPGTSAALNFPTRTPSTTSATAMSIDPGRTTAGFGHATTTTTGTETMHRLHTEQALDLGAYFVKVKTGFGALFRDLSDAERQQIKPIRGVVVTSIVNNSPAFNADILPGDIVTAIDGAPVAGANAIQETTDRPGQTIVVALVRNGSSLTKSVALAR